MYFQKQLLEVFYKKDVFTIFAIFICPELCGNCAFPQNFRKLGENYGILCSACQVPLREKCLYSEFFSSYFPAFGLNTERYSVFVYIQSLCAKIRTKKIPNTDTFHAVYLIRLITSNFFPPISVDSKKVN